MNKPAWEQFADAEKYDSTYDGIKIPYEYEDKLKPCPFCGNRAELTIFNYNYGTVTVGCTNEECDITMGKAFFTDEEAIRHWNRRTK